MKKRKLINAGNIYVALIDISLIPLMLLTADHGFWERLPFLLFWFALEIAADLKPFRVIYYQQMEMTMSFAVQLSVVILLGTREAVWVVVLATMIVEIISRKQWYKLVFNAGQYGLSIAATGLMFHLLKLSPASVTLDIVLDLPAILVAVTTYYLLNTFFISLVIALTSGCRFRDIFFSDFKIIAGYFFSLAPISIGASLLYSERYPYVILIMVPPLIMADQALRRYYSLNQETQETLQVLATTIDQRDSYTSQHSQRVAEYARKIAEKMGLSSDDVVEVEMAGQVHDLGKVGVEDRILRKASRLNDEEYEQIKRHPEVAYNMLKNLKPYARGAEYVLYHHEHIDGRGYPTGVSGDSIPQGARIIAVADSYDAMTSDRPYRKALPADVAVKELRRCSGTQFDPQVVDAFIQILKDEYGYVEV